MTQESEVLFSRSDAKHGLKAIRVESSPDGRRLYRVRSEDGMITAYDSARQLLVALTGHPQARHWTFERYFRLWKYRPAKLRAAEMPGNRPTLDVFGITPSIIDPFEGLTLPPMGKDAPRVITFSPALTITSSFPLLERVPNLDEALTVSSRPTVFGIDLVRRGREVAKLFYAGFGARVAGAGIDPEEVLQEVYRGLLVRNAGTCPWDARKSSFGHYVHMVCSCIVSNFFRRENRRRAMEQVGIRSRTGEGLESIVDVASDDALLPPGESALLGDEGAFSDLLQYINYNGTPEARAHVDVLRLMRLGFNRSEVARQLGLPAPLVSRLFAVFQEIVLEWSAH